MYIFIYTVRSIALDTDVSLMDSHIRQQNSIGMLTGEGEWQEWVGMQRICRVVGEISGVMTGDSRMCRADGRGRGWTDWKKNGQSG